MTADEIRRSVCAAFPSLQSSPFEITSEPSRRNNCIAWAARVDRAWWWPGGPYGPNGVQGDTSIRAFAEAFGKLGYSPCDTGASEVGFEKVALSVGQDGAVLHAARQLVDGTWTSKLGEAWDITHELEKLEGEHYGQVACFLRRPLPRPL